MQYIVINKLTRQTNKLRRQVVIQIVDIGGIVDNHCLNFLFITNEYNIIANINISIDNNVTCFVFII